MRAAAVDALHFLIVETHEPLPLAEYGRPFRAYLTDKVTPVFPLALLRPTPLTVTLLCSGTTRVR